MSRTIDTSKGVGLRAGRPRAIVSRSAHAGSAHRFANKTQAKRLKFGKSVVARVKRSLTPREIAILKKLVRATEDASFAAPSTQSQRLRFGSVTIEGGVPSADVVERNVATGQSALKRGLAALVRPGVTLPRGDGVPIYRADLNDPTILIRELDGRQERGTFADGEFKVVK